MTTPLNYNLSIEQNFLIEILKTMYEDNINQINNMTNSINSIRNNNTQIRNLLLEIIIYSNNNNRNNNINAIINNNTNTTDTQTTQRNLGRIILNNLPYVVENIQQYNIPIPQQNENVQRGMNFLSTLAQTFLQPVQIIPTQSQIETATRNVRYCDILNPINRSCPISLELFNDNDMVSVIRFCGHIFKQEQLVIWFSSNCRCPVCRYDIRIYNSNETLNNTTPQIDASNNNIPEQTNYSLPNNINNNYLDIFFDENLINEITNINGSTNSSGLSTLFSSLQRRML
jgi:hypothetical protein